MSNELEGGRYASLEDFLMAVDPVSGETHGKRFIDAGASLHTVLQAFEAVRSETLAKPENDLGAFLRAKLRPRKVHVSMDQPR